MKKSSFVLSSAARFVIPFVLGLGVIGGVGLLLSEEIRGIYWSLISAYFFPPLGKESVIPTGIALNIHPVVLALSIAYVDIIVSLFLLWNYDLAKKIPLIGRFIIKVENIGDVTSGKYSWITPLRFIGIMLFVMVPFQGSGGLVGTILGRLIGMKSWSIFCAISIGSISGCLLIAYFAELIKSVVIQNMLAGVFIVIILVIFGVMILAYTKSKKRNNGAGKQEKK